MALTSSPKIQYEARALTSNMAVFTHGLERAVREWIDGRPNKLRLVKVTTIVEELDQ